MAEHPWTPSYPESMRSDAELLTLSVQELDIRAEPPKTPIGKLSKKALVDEEARKRAA